MAWPRASCTLQASILNSVCATLLAQQPPLLDLSAAVYPGVTESRVLGAEPGALVALVLGLSRTPSVLPGGALLLVSPDAVAPITFADAERRARVSVRFLVGAGAGLAFHTQALSLAVWPAIGASNVASLRVPLPGETAEIVILFGQSNGEGAGLRSELDEQLRGPRPDTRIWHEIAGEWQVLVDGVNSTTLLLPGICGPEMALAHGLASGARPLHLVKMAAGMTALGPTPGPWNEWGPQAGELYTELLRRLDRATAALAATGLRPRVRGAFWMQGESDATRADWSQAYENNLTQLIATLRSDLVQRSLAVTAVPFVIGQIDAALPPAGFPFTTVVRQAQARVAVTLPACKLVDTTGLPLAADGVHFAMPRLSALGAGFATALSAIESPTEGGGR